MVFGICYGQPALVVVLHDGDRPKRAPLVRHLLVDRERYDGITLCVCPFLSLPSMLISYEHSNGKPLHMSAVKCSELSGWSCAQNIHFNPYAAM